MDLLSIFLTLVLALLFIFLFVNLLSNRSHKPKDGANLYLIALSHMLHNEDEAAIKAFKELVRKDTENIDAYINLGILLRKTGKLNNAIKIHQNLIFRQNLNPGQRIEILRNLCEDYVQLKDAKTALKYALQVLEIDANNLWALRRVSELYRDLKQWEKASEFLEKAFSFELNPDNRLLALYKVQEGLDKYAAKEYHEARVIFRKALKIDPNCEAACYYIARAYVEDKREVDSIEWFVRFADIAPAKAPLVFEPLQTILYNLGYFGNIESFYQNLLHKRPNDPAIILALARFYIKKGDIGQAKTVLTNLLEHDHHRIDASLLLCRIYIHQNDLDSATDLLNALVDSAASTQREYQCKQCGNRLETITWICPECGAADSYFG